MQIAFLQNMIFRRIIILALIILAPKLYAENQIIDDNILLQSIAQVESSNQHHIIGRAGEKTKYQFREGTWRQYSSTPFLFIDSKHYELESEVVAYKHLAKIKKFLSVRNQYSVKNVAFIWNAGFGSYRRGILPRTTRLHIKKVEKVYLELLPRNP